MSFHFCRVQPEQLALAENLTSKWPDKNLPWTVMNELPNVSFADLKAAADSGFNWWMKCCGLKPVYTAQPQDARLRIYTAKIDGSGGVLADCELPYQGAQFVRMRLDVGEDWDVGLTPVQRKINLAFVISHEGGHGIGLGHAPQGTKNRMAPVYDPTVVNAGSWDAAQSQARYGQAVLVPTPTPAPTPQPTPSGGFDMGGLLTTLLKLAPVINWLMQNKDQLGPLLDALKAIFNAAQAAPPKLRVVENVVVKDDFRSLLATWVAALKTTATVTTTQWDDMAAALLEQALATDWLFDLLWSIAHGEVSMTDELLAAALAGDQAKVHALTA